MPSDLLQKRKQLDRQHARLQVHFAQTKSRLADTATSPPAILSAIAAGYVLYRLAGRKTSSPTPGESESPSPMMRRFTILAGGLLGTAIRRSLLGLIRDLGQSDVTAPN